MLRALVIPEPGTVSADLCCLRAVNSPKEWGIGHPKFCVGLWGRCIAVGTLLLQQRKQFPGGGETL